MSGHVEVPVRPGRVGAVFGALLVPSFVALGAPSVALPSIARSLGVPFGASSWVLASWALSTALAMPFFGRISARVGLRTCLLTGVILITVGSLLAALAPGLAVLIIGRAVGGAGAGAVVISSYASVAARLQGAERARALGIVAAIGTTASACGTVIGGRRSMSRREAQPDEPADHPPVIGMATSDSPGDDCYIIGLSTTLLPLSHLGVDVGVQLSFSRRGPQGPPSPCRVAADSVRWFAADTVSVPKRSLWSWRAGRVTFGLSGMASSRCGVGRPVARPAQAFIAATRA